jgi:predicted dehydrogenase
MGDKRAAALEEDELVGCYDTSLQAAARLAEEHGGLACSDLDELLGLSPDVVIVATPHHALAQAVGRAVEAGADVLVEKPGATSAEEADSLDQLARSRGRLVKVGFNHRFHPGIARAVEDARSGRYDEIMFVRGRYGHGGRLGYEREWRAQPELSGGGELMDQGMHLLDLSYWLLGPVPLHGALLRTSFWNIAVEDNAVVTLAEVERSAPWTMFHVSWSEWKNEFALEIYCRRAKLQVLGLGGSYGPQVLRVYEMRPELGPPDVTKVAFPDEDVSWVGEWRHFREAIAERGRRQLLGDLASASYALGVVQEAYRSVGG